MKKFTTLVIVMICAIVGFAQNEKSHFCTLDTSEHKERNFAYEGMFNVDITGGAKYFTNDQYVFKIPEVDLNAAFMVIMDVELSSPENKVYEKIGTITCAELHAPINKKDVTEPGKYATTWGFKKDIEIWFNGEYVQLVFPQLGKEGRQSYKHSFFVKMDCYEDMVAAFKSS